MEGNPNTTNEVINLEKEVDGTWRMRSEEAHQKAEKLLSGIPDFEHMSTSEQVTSLIDLMGQLSKADESNESDENYYTIEELAKRTTALEALARYQQTMYGIPGIGQQIDVRV